MTSLLDLMQPPPDRRCGTCVVYNRTAPDTGTCSIAGPVLASGEPVRPDCWFSMDQLRAALYGRKP